MPTIAIQGTGFALSDGIRQFVYDKLADALRPLGDTDLNPIRIEVELEHRTRHLDDESGVQAYRAEATLTGYGTTFRAEGASDGLEQAVVEMKHKLTRQLRDWRARLRDGQRRGARETKRSG